MDVLVYSHFLLFGNLCLLFFLFSLNHACCVTHIRNLFSSPAFVCRSWIEFFGCSRNLLFFPFCSIRNGFFPFYPVKVPYFLLFSYSILTPLVMDFILIPIFFYLEDALWEKIMPLGNKEWQRRILNVQMKRTWMEFLFLCVLFF